MKKLLHVYKPKGMTPLQVVESIKQKFPEYKDEKIGYAGRLDPLAHGLLLLMIGEETTKQKDEYLNLSKQYEFEAVFGVATDTYDVLGMLKYVPVKNSQSNKRLLRSLSVARNDVQKFINSKLGKQTQTYPPFSSKTVQGKPLHWWAKNKKLSEITIPTREIEIYDFKLLGINEILVAKLEEEVMQQINSVQGDFRQKEIKEKWEEFFYHYSQSHSKHKNAPNGAFPTARFSLSCSSGTYVRSLVNELGETLACGAVTLEILRTKVGEYSLDNSFS